MKLMIVAGLAGLATICAGSQAFAQRPGDWYVAAAATAGRLDSAKMTVTNAPTPGSTLRVSNAIETGWGGHIAAGRRLGSLRIEGEIGRQNNASDSYTTLSPFVATLPQDGETDITRAMVNGYYEFLAPDARFRPYLGIGFGAAEVSVLRINAIAAAPSAPPQRRVDYSDTGFAWQAMAGASWAVSSNLSLTARYRWFDRGETPGRDMRGQAVKIDVATHNIDIGFRYHF